MTDARKAAVSPAAARVPDLPRPTPEQDLLASIYLYVGRFVFRQLTTEQRELWADAVDAHGAWLAATEPGWGPAYRVPRWWREDYVIDPEEP